MDSGKVTISDSFTGVVDGSVSVSTRFLLIKAMGVKMIVTENKRILKGMSFELRGIDNIINRMVMRILKLTE
jgi:hypothetical protein